MAFALTFAGKPFCVDQSDILAWIDKHICLDDLCETMPPARYPGRNLGALGPHPWPRRPKLRIGQFFYPVGASRWAEFHGLMTASAVRAVMATTFTHLSAGPVAAPFVIRSDAGDYTPDSPSGVTTALYMLPPRPLSQLQQAVPEAPLLIDDLYVVTLVDERYFWRQSGGNLGKLASTWTWGDLVSTIATGLGVTITVGSIPAAYGTPAADSPLWCTGWDNAAELLDRIAFHIGCLVVRAYEGTYTLMPVSTKTYSTSQRPWRIAGGLLDAPASLLETTLPNGTVHTYVPYLEAVLPSTISVVFPSFLASYGYFVNADNQTVTNRENLARFIPWIRDQYLATYGVDVTIDQATGTDQNSQALSQYAGNGGAFVIRDASIAYFTNYADSSPSNLTDLQDLAQQLANDYWNFLAGGNDEVYPGIRHWVPEPFHDLLFSYNSARTATTRVQRLPYNSWPQDFAHRAVGTALDGPTAGPAIEVVKVDSDATEDAHGKYGAHVQRWDSASQLWAADSEAVWLMDPNGSTLSTGNLYGGCRLIGWADNRKVYAAGQAVTGTITGGAMIMVEDDRGLPPAVDVNVLVCWPYYAFEVTQPNVNQAWIRRLWEAWGGTTAALVQDNVWKMIFSSVFVVSAGGPGVVNVDLNLGVGNTTVNVTNVYTIHYDQNSFTVINEGGGTVLVSRIFQVYVDTTKIDGDNIYKQTFSPACAWDITSPAAGQVVIKRKLRVQNDLGGGADDIATITLAPANCWNLVGDGNCGITVKRLLTVTGANTGGGISLSDIYLIQFNSDDFITDGDAGQAGVSTNGYTGNVDFCHSDGTIHRMVFKDGLLKQVI